jgi:hypothetical protein
MADDRRGMAYLWTTWHLIPRARTLVAPRVIAELERVCGGVPAALETEAALVAFCNEAGIRLADADIEPHIILPNQTHPSRDWVRDLYLGFREWAIQEGWIHPPVAENLPAERPKRRRREATPDVFADATPDV